MVSSTDSPRTLVIGPGAIGAFIAARLTESGRSVAVLARGDTLEALRDRPLTLEDDGERRDVDLTVVGSVEEADGTDVALVCTKSFDTPGVATALAEANYRGIVLSLQNGVHNIALLADALPDATVGGAAVYLGCERRSPTHVARRPSRNPRTGALRDRLVGGPDGAAGDALAAVGSDCGIATEVLSDPDRALWTKLVANVALNTVTALGRARVGTVFANQDAARLMVALGDEVVAVARAKGIPIAPDAAEAYVSDARTRLPAEGGSSTLFDLEAGRRLEREALVGAVVAEARGAGVAVPHAAACDAIMRLVDPTSVSSRGTSPV